MEHILYQLFYGNYDITPKRDEKQQELSAACLAELDKIAAVYGTEFVDRLCDLEGKQEEWREFHYYRSGFVLGARLMLEALS